MPIIVRLPSGGGFSGGPVPLAEPRVELRAHPRASRCVCPATPEDAKGLLIEAIEDPNPVLYFEHKHLYRRIKDEVPDERYTVPFGEARTHREGDDVSLITWGAMVYTADEAAEKLEDDGVSVEILDLRTLTPWDKEAVLALGREDVEGARPPRGHAHRRLRRRDRGDDRRGGLRGPRRAGAPHRRARHPGAVLAAAREGFHPAGRRRGRRLQGARGVLGLLMATTGTAVDVVMPQMGVSVSEGTITKWLKSEGEAIAADESLLEISTDKVDTEVPSPANGVLQQILAQEGETVAVGTKIAVIAPEGAEVEAEAPPEPPTQEAAQEAEAASGAEGEGPAAAKAAEAPAPEPEPEHEAAPDRRQLPPRPPRRQRRGRQRPARGEVRLPGRRADRGRARRRRRRASRAPAAAAA